MQQLYNPNTNDASKQKEAPIYIHYHIGKLVSRVVRLRKLQHRKTFPNYQHQKLHPFV